jgi:hypothetical protein
MSARTETLGAGSHGVRLAWYVIALASSMLLAAAILSTQSADERPAVSTTVVQAPANVSPGSGAAERTAIRERFAPSHGVGAFRGTVKAGSVTSAVGFDPARLPGAFRGTVKAGAPAAGTIEDSPPWARVAPFRR